MSSACKDEEQIEAAIVRLKILQGNWKRRLEQLREEPMWFSELLRDLFKVIIISYNFLMPLTVSYISFSQEIFDPERADSSVKQTLEPQTIIAINVRSTTASRFSLPSYPCSCATA